MVRWDIGQTVLQPRTKLSCILCKGTHWVGLCSRSVQNSFSSRENISGGSRPHSYAQSQNLSAKGHRGTIVKDGQSTSQKSEETRISAKSPEKLGDERTTSSKMAVRSTHGSGGRSVALPTATVKVKKLGVSRKQVTMRVFFNLGSQKSFGHLSWVEKLDLTPTRYTVIGLAVFGQEPVTVRFPVIELKLALRKRVAVVKFLVTDKVSTTIDSPSLVATAADLWQKGVRLADGNAIDEMDDVQAVIGADYLGRFIT